MRILLPLVVLAASCSGGSKSAPTMAVPDGPSVSYWAGTIELDLGAHGKHQFDWVMARSINPGAGAIDDHVVLTAEGKRKDADVRIKVAGGGGSLDASGNMALGSGQGDVHFKGSPWRPSEESWSVADQNGDNVALDFDASGADLDLHGHLKYGADKATIRGKLVPIGKDVYDQRATPQPGPSEIDVGGADSDKS